jgi:hypothetical protein
MPLGLGLAASHAPNMFMPPEEWGARYVQAIGDVPQPLAAQHETLEVRTSYANRIEAGWDALRERLEAYKPDKLIMVTDDHSEMFDQTLCNPNIAMFLGERGVGTLNLRTMTGMNQGNTEIVSFDCDVELAEFLATGLVERDFDLTVSRSKESKSIGPRDRGIGHGFTRTAPKLMPKLDIPAVLIWLNCYYDPMPTARRCLALGRAIAEVVRDRKERIALVGTGGLSHDPMGPRAGWIDEPLDRSVLKAFADGEPNRLSNLFSIKSDTLHGGTGEIRNWLVVAGAMGDTRAEIIDYMPIHHIITGVAFAAWQPWTSVK